MKRNLIFGHLGNGLTVWNDLKEIRGDYEKVAHIKFDRSVTIYVDDLSNKDLESIIDTAKNDTSKVSVTQHFTVFNIPPTDQVKVRFFKTNKEVIR